MPHEDNLILTLVAGFVLAFLLGMVALRLRLSPIVGYLLAGVAVGPFTPGWVADGQIAAQLAEVGVILLMFGVGLHFSPADLLRVRRVAVPGALAQILAATALGWGVGRLLGLPHTEAALMGFALSVASTVVLLRALEERGAIKSEAGQLAVGWLIVEDLVMVLALVLLPLVAASAGASLPRIGAELGWTLVRIGLFVAVMLVVGGRVFPWLLVRIAHTRSRELFTLGVLSIALGIAFLAYSVFGASFALGAFIAGLVLNGTPLGHNAAERALPLRDAFAVLFFVSVGMLFNPAVIVEQPAAVLAVVLIVLVGKSLAALAITALFRVPRSASFIVAASLAQIGEFSFILAGLGLRLDIMSPATHDLILAAALFSIVLNPFAFRLADRLSRRRSAEATAPGGGPA